MRIVRPIINIVLIFLLSVAPAAAETSEVRVGFANVLLAIPFQLTRHLRYFEDEGLDLRYEQMDSGKAALKRMLEKADLDIVFAAQTPVVYNSFSQDDFVLLGAIAVSYNDLKILARKDKDIITISDLQRRRIGITRVSASHAFLSLLLTHNIILKSDVTLIDVDPKDLTGALQRGTVDAIVSWEPNIQRTRNALGSDVHLVETPNIYREDYYIVARKSFARENPETLIRFLKALLRAEEFIQERREEAVASAAEILELDKNVVSALWGDFEFRIFFDQAILINLEDEARWMIREGLTRRLNIPNYLDYIEPGILREVKPEAVTVF